MLEGGWNTRRSDRSIAAAAGEETSRLRDWRANLESLTTAATTVIASLRTITRPAPQDIITADTKPARGPNLHILQLLFGKTWLPRCCAYNQRPLEAPNIGTLCLNVQRGPNSIWTTHFNP